MRLTLFVLIASFSNFVGAAPAERIISLAPHTTELAFAAGLGDKLVAVSDRSNYPESAQSLEKVANYQGIKIERILALEPDLVIAWPSGNPEGLLNKLKQFGINIYYSETHSLEDIAANIEKLSEYAQDPQIGKTNASKFRAQLKALKQRYNTDSPVRYFYQLSEHPIITLSQDKWPSEVFAFCGGENIFGSSAAPYPQVSKEQVIIQNPEVIFTSDHAMSPGNMWADWSEQLFAVQNQHIWSLNSDWINRPTPRTLKAIQQVCEHFETVRRKR